jgi:hypothetical protein
MVTGGEEKFADEMRYIPNKKPDYNSRLGSPVGRKNYI